MIFNSYTSAVVAVLFLQSPPSILSTPDCMDIIGDGCISIDTFLGEGTCRLTSSFGPHLSNCLYPGRNMFNKAITKHGNFQDPIRAVCSGKVKRTGNFLHGKRSFAIVSEHTFTEKCMFDNKVYESFELYYGHSDGGDSRGPIMVGSSVKVGDIFAFVGKCEACAWKNPPSIMTFLVKIGESFVNPMALFSDSGGGKIKGTFQNFYDKTHLKLEAPCETLTVNRFETKCGDKTYVYDFNTREGFPSYVKGPPPHTTYRPKDGPFIWGSRIWDGKWLNSFYIPQYWFGNDNCCTVTIKDLWGDIMFNGSHCWVKPY